MEAGIPLHLCYVAPTPAVRIMDSRPPTPFAPAHFWGGRDDFGIWTHLSPSPPPLILTLRGFARLPIDRLPHPFPILLCSSIWRPLPRPRGSHCQSLALRDRPWSQCPVSGRPRGSACRARLGSSLRRCPTSCVAMVSMSRASAIAPSPRCVRGALRHLWLPPVQPRERLRSTGFLQWPCVPCLRGSKEGSRLVL